MKFQRQLCNGSWIDETRVDKFIGHAIDVEEWLAPLKGRKPRTAQGILEQLAKGEIVTTGTDWYDRIRDADAQKRPPARRPDYPDGRELDCGCTVYNAIEVMNASMGSACSYCYDRMSD